MRRPGIDAIVYLIGIVLLGFFYEPIKTAIGSNAIFAMAAIAYLLALRGVGRVLRRMVQR